MRMHALRDGYSSIPLSRSLFRLRSATRARSRALASAHGGRVLLDGVAPFGVGGAPVLDRAVSSTEEAGHPVRQELAGRGGGDAVGGDGDVVVGGDDGPRQAAGLLADAAMQNVRISGFGWPVFGFVGAFVEVGGVGVAGAGHRHVEHGAGGVLPQHRMCGVGGNALGGVHGRGVAVGDVLGDVVGVEYGAARSVRRSAAIRPVAGSTALTRQRSPLRTASCAGTVSSLECQTWMVGRYGGSE